MTATTERQERAAEGDTAEAWLQGNFPLLCFAIRRVLEVDGPTEPPPLTRDDINDLAQVASLRLIERWDRYDPTRGTRINWCCRVATNLAIDLVRTRDAERRRWERAVAAHVADTALERRVVHIDEQALDRVEAQEAWDRLRPHERREVALTFQGYSLPEISRRLGIPLGTAKSRQFEWRKRLAKEARQEEGGQQSVTSTPPTTTIPGVSGASGTLTIYSTTRRDGTPGCVVSSFPDEVYVTPALIGKEDRRVTLDERKGRLYLEVDNATATYAAPAASTSNRWARLYQDISYPYAPPVAALAAPTSGTVTYDSYDD